ncbi:MAG: deoxyhypusine synthase [Candidatus Thermoplasmatota archaeon]|nr:deoxyhypusine synthase [Candidatus Thermoplasmatota archaeon]
MRREDLLSREVKHIEIDSFDSTPIIEAFEDMSFQARNLARAAKIYDQMISDSECTIILCLSGSIFSAGLKRAVHQLVSHNMVDVVVASGAVIVDQDFFEALGFSHYRGTPLADDEMLRGMMIDRIYDTLIDENDLRECDMTVARIADGLPPGSYSSREFIAEMGRSLSEGGERPESVVLECYEKGIPIFVPAFSDCSAGFGLVYHQSKRDGEKAIAIDSVKDFRELTRIKTLAAETGLLIIGGGVPKNFAQDVTVAAGILGEAVSMHKYAVQITVADERDGSLSGSTLREAHSWGKVDRGSAQMVFCEATIAFPLIASYVYHAGNWRDRIPRDYNRALEDAAK